MSVESKAGESTMARTFKATSVKRRMLVDVDGLGCEAGSLQDRPEPEDDGGDRGNGHQQPDRGHDVHQG
jgi:hypothetical protein